MGSPGGGPFLPTTFEWGDKQTEMLECLDMLGNGRGEESLMDRGRVRRVIGVYRGRRRTPPRANRFTQIVVLQLSAMGG